MNRGAAAVVEEFLRRQQHDVLGEKLTDPFQLARLYGATKCEHVNLLSSAAHLGPHR